MSEKIQDYLEAGKKNLILVYICCILAAITMNSIISIVGLVFSYINKSEQASEYLYSHYQFAFKSLYLFIIIHIILDLISKMSIDYDAIHYLSGILLYPSVIIWLVMRSILAIQFLLEGTPHPKPLTFWIK